MLKSNEYAYLKNDGLLERSADVAVQSGVAGRAG
jgi:hypothetical protein